MWSQCYEKLRKNQENVLQSLSYLSSRKQQVILSRLRIGNQNNTPYCNQCQTNITVKRILMECPNYSHSKTVEIDGQPINYVQVGNGAKTVLCCPGALGSIWSDFKPQIENLDRDQLTIIAWDPPGYGHSRPPMRKFGVKFYEEDADWAQRFMAKLGINKYSILGWSDGGVSGMIMAAKYPDNVEKLVMWGVNSYLVEEEIQKCEDLRDISKWSANMRDPLVAIYTEKGLEDMWNGWVDTALEFYKNGDICSDVLENIKCPVFIIHGDKDQMVAPEHPIFLTNKIKGAKLYRYPDGKHNLHLKYATDFNKRVTEFIVQ